MTYREIKFTGLAALLLVVSVIGITFFLPVNTQEELEFKSNKSKHVKAPFGHPDKFIEYFAAVTGVNEGYDPYPQGYQMEEFKRATLANAKRGTTTQLAWIERGPGRTGGRTRAILVDHTDSTGNTWYIGSVGGGIWKARRYTDPTDIPPEKIEWTPLTDHLPSLAVSAMAGSSVNHPEIIYVGTGEGFNVQTGGYGTGMLKTIDGGKTWTHLTSTTNNPNWAYINRIIADPDNPDLVLAATNTRVFRSEDGGQSFSVVLRGKGGPFQDLVARPDDFNVQFTSVNGRGIFRSTDGGKTWENSFSGFVFGGSRIELAISQSHPEVIWASVQSSTARPSDDLYRSVDSGESWTFIDNLPGVPEEYKSFLGGQGWYDHTIAVHPFSPDTVYIGGVNRYKSWIEGDGIQNLGTIGRFSNNASSFLGLINFGASHIGGTVDLGPFDPQASDIKMDEMVSIEIRFGPGIKQFAHRYSVPPNGGTAGDGGAGIPFRNYIYEDYVEVPFQVWDTDNNRQLMASFRDQQDNGVWDLIPATTTGPGNTHSRDYLFISKHDYDENSPLSNYTVNGGFTSGLMYFIWPVLNGGEGVTFDPNALPSSKIDIDFVLIEGQTRNLTLWENGNVHVDHHNLITIPIDESKNKFHILNTNDGGFAYSKNSGKTWREGDNSPGYNTAQFYDVTKHPDAPIYFGGTQDNGTWMSGKDPDNQRGWRYMLGGDGFDVLWKSADSLMGSIYNNWIFRSIDGGANWEVAGNIRNWAGSFLTSLSWTPESGDAVFAMSPNPNAGLLRTLDFGESWHAIPSSNPGRWAGHGFSGKVRVSLADPSVVWVGYRMNGGGRLHVSENALNPVRGENVRDPVRLRPVNSPNFAPTSILAGLATHPFSRATAYVTFAVSCRPKLLRTEDMGQTWEDLSGFAGSDGCRSSNGFPNAKVWDVVVFPEKPRIIWAGTDIGIFESRDHGQTWAYADNGIPASIIYRIRIIGDEVVVATHGRGIWSLDLSEVMTSVEEEAVAELPTSFELLENYPNPFNPSTTIGFNLVNDSHIRVTVFDLLGRKVATLTDQPYSRGTHQITWDASGMSSGQYIYRMEADGQLIGARSMMLVK